MKVLALETADQQCSICILEDDQELFFQLDTRAKAQTQTILPMIEQGFSQLNIHTPDLTAIAFSRGPGSFSGVRIDAAVTQALAWSNDLPVIPVSTLQAIAQAAYHLNGLKQVTTVSDARMNEVYIASFELDASGIMQAIDEEKLLGYEDAKSYVKYTIVGSGANLVQENPSEYVSINASAKEVGVIAMALAQQQLWVSAELALPVYLRDNAWKKIADQGKA